MLLSEYVQIKWNSKIKNHYTDRGYTFTKMGDVFYSKVEDLTNGSGANVVIQCDYCGREYTKMWHQYLNERSGAVQTDCCGECKAKKIEETTLKKYGVRSQFSLQSVRDKIAKTNLDKYGCENPFAANEVKDKIARTCVSRYGHKSASQADVVKEKIKKTCLERYGVEYYILKQVHYGVENPRWKGGVAYHRQERSTIDYIRWRSSVYVRDQYTCQKCGAHTGNGKAVTLNAHHIRNWRDNEDLRYDINNGITLCKKCHDRFHSLYGKKNNNEVQLVEFLNSNGEKIC